MECRGRIIRNPTQANKAAQWMSCPMGGSVIFKPKIITPAKRRLLAIQSINPLGGKVAPAGALAAPPKSKAGGKGAKGKGKAPAKSGKERASKAKGKANSKFPPKGKAASKADSDADGSADHGQQLGLDLASPPPKRQRSSGDDGQATTELSTKSGREKYWLDDALDLIDQVFHGYGKPAVLLGNDISHSVVALNIQFLVEKKISLGTGKSFTKWSAARDGIVKYEREKLKVKFGMVDPFQLLDWVAGASASAAPAKPLKVLWAEDLTQCLYKDGATIQAAHAFFQEHDASLPMMMSSFCNKVQSAIFKYLCNVKAPTRP